MGDDNQRTHATAPMPAPFSAPEGESGAPAELTTERPTHVDRYEIRNELGRGAMGSVFAAWDPKLCREVAIKLVALQQRNNAKGRARFLREARSIAAIGQPNVVQIFDYSGLDSEALYLVMEKLEGRDLWELMHTHKMFPEAIAALVGHELCLALEAAHQVGIIHRDLKPENVFVTHAGRVVLTDFGIVKAIATDAAVDGYTERTEVIGTPGFMAPELLRGKSLTQATDIFALGALLYNVATLQMPYEGQSPMAQFQAAQKGEYVDPRRHQPQLSAAFCALLERCLKANPAERPASAADLRVALRAILDDLAEHRFGDDMLSWLADPQGFAGHSHQRAVAHVLSEMAMAHARGQVDEVVRAKERLLALDPFNSDWQPLLADKAAVAFERTSHSFDPAQASSPVLPLRRADGAATVVPARRRGSSPRTPRRLAAVGLLALVVAVCATDTWAWWSQDADAGRADAAAAAAPAPVAAVPVVVETNRPEAPAPGALARVGEDEPWARPAPAPAARKLPVILVPSEATLAPPPAAELSTDLPRDIVDRNNAPSLEVSVPGRGGWLILDGRRVGHIHDKVLSLAPGRHRLVILRAGRALKRWIYLGRGQHRVWQAR